LLPAGAQAPVFLGINSAWDDATCGWDLSDSQITTMVNNTKDDPKVYGYFVSDEPNPFLCPNAVQAHRARVALIRSLTKKPTVMVLDSNRGQETLDQIPLWVGVTDYDARRLRHQGSPVDDPAHDLRSRLDEHDPALDDLHERA
jgi:hypothetical protein